MKTRAARAVLERAGGSHRHVASTVTGGGGASSAAVQCAALCDFAV